jgi:hypothetical protein
MEVTSQHYEDFQIAIDFLKSWNEEFHYEECFKTEKL